MNLIARLLDRLTDSLMSPKTWEFQSASYPTDTPRTPLDVEPRRHPRSTAP